MTNKQSFNRIIKVLNKIHRANPTLRFGQILDNATRNLVDVFFVENEELEMLLTFFYRKTK